MTQTPEHRPNEHGDRGKPNTPDRFRNDKARWKEHDQPDDPRDNQPDPERDYPDAEAGVPR